MKRIFSQGGNTKRTLFILLALLAVAAWADQAVMESIGNGRYHIRYDGDGVSYYTSSVWPTKYSKVQMEGTALCVYKTIVPTDKSIAPIHQKDIYGVFAGRIVKLKTIIGKVVPAQPERVEWPEEK